MNFDIIYEKIFEKFTITEIVALSVIIIFTCGLITGYILTLHHIYHQIDNLINTGRLLLFNDKIYKIIEIDKILINRTI